MKTVVAPVDFTDVSINAAEYAADLAGAIHADLALIHFCPIPVSYGEVPAPVYNMAEMLDDAIKLISQLKQRLQQRAGDSIEISTEVRGGPVLQGIEEYCSMVRPYAVVMGAENASAFERLLFGAKSTAAIRRLSWPLIIVPPEARFSKIRRIGLACDFREVAETLPVREIQQLLRQFNAEMHILHVTGINPLSADKETIDQASLLQSMFTEFHPKYDFIKDGNVEEAIMRFSEKNHLDLLIVIPKKHQILAKIFQYSHAKRMILHAHVPVLSIHE